MRRSALGLMRHTSEPGAITPTTRRAAMSDATSSMILRALLLSGALLVASAAGAAPLSFVSPVADGGAVAPDAVFEIALVRLEGERLYPVGDAVFSGAVARPAPDALFAPARVRAPLSGQHVVLAQVGDEEARLSFAVRPLDELDIALEPAQATKVDGQTPPVTVRVKGGSAGVRPHLAASSGRLSELVEEAPGSWSAQFHAGAARFPEVVVITAARPWPDEGSPAFALAHAVLPLSSAIVLPGESRANVEVTVQIGPSAFGPVRSDAAGRFDIPVVVPPGIGRATGISVDRLGTRRATQIDLRLPPTNRIAVAAFPTVLVAGEDTEASIAVVVVDKTGGPGRDMPVLKARRGKVSGLRALQGGRFIASYTPPATPGVDVVEARLADRSAAEVTVSVRPGPPVEVTAMIERALLTAPSNAQAEVEVSARDARGQAVADARFEARAARGGSAVARGAQGARVRYTPPSSARPWTDRLQVRAQAAPGTLAAAVALAPRGDGSVGLLAIDVVGRPVPRAPLRVSTGGALNADGEGFLPVAVVAGRFTLHVQGSALPATLLIARGPDGTLRGWPSHPGVRTTHADIDLMEPTLVDVRVTRAADGALQWRVIGGGEGERRVAISLANRRALLVGRVGTMPLATEVFEAPVTVTDLASGVSAVLLP